MLRNQLLIVLRHWLRYRVDTLIKVISLTAGITGCLLILLFVQHEWRYDDFHTQAIYRVYSHFQSPSQDMKAVITPKPLAHFMVEHLPEVKQVVRIRKDKVTVQQHNQLVRESIVLADTNFLSLFAFPLQAGNPEEALQNPHSVVLTPVSAEKYFGTQDVLGKTLRISLAKDSLSDFIVTGLTEPIPTNTTVPFTLLLPFQQKERTDEGTWGGGKGITYASLHHQVNPGETKEKLNRQLREALLEEMKYHTYHLQSLADVYRSESVYGEIVPPIDARYLYIAGSVALLLLVIACINFTALALGRSVSRSREVGVRKTLGASRLQLMRQFLGESFLLTLGISLFSFGLAYALLPYFSQLLHKPIEIFLTDPLVLSLLAGIVLMTGFLSGFYPAWVLSGLSTSRVLKGQSVVNRRHRLIGALITLQFVGTIALLVGSVGMHRQLALLQNKALGFEESYVVRLEIPERSAKLFQQFRSQVASLPEVEAVTASWQLFGHEAAGVGYHVLPYTTEDQEVRAYAQGVGPDFLKTIQVELLRGRSFSDWSDNPPHHLVVNESFVKVMGWDDPLGKRVSGLVEFEDSEIVGVVKDFHFLSLHQPIGPLIMYPTNTYSNFYVRMASGQIPTTLEKLEQAWKSVAPDAPFVFHFMDEDIARQYETEQRWASVITYTSLLVIFIACLGLFGMASLLTQQRTKEIGIRKVLGASVANLLVLLSRDYVKLLGIALLIAIPVANYFVQEWLNSFAYRASIGWWVYALIGIAVLGLALVTVSAQTLKAARRNPVDSLRYE